MSSIFERYNRQMLIRQIGEDGQRRISHAKAVVAGCGALGSVIANVLARAGVGHLVILDRDFVEESNLQRQTLFDEQDCRENLPKAVAAERKLKQINSQIQITGLVVDINPTNVEKLIADASVVVDGADNFETRFVLNDACVKHNQPWIYGAAVGTTGMTMTIIPEQTPCLRCLFEAAPPPGLTPTCDTVGVLGALTGLIGNYEASEALKICAGQREAINQFLFSIDLWSSEMRQIKIAKARETADCLACKRHKFEFLEGIGVSVATKLCGRNVVQINPRCNSVLNLQNLAAQMKNTSGITGVQINEFLLKFNAPGGDDGQGLEITVFPDSRAIIKGAKKISDARSIYAKYIGV